ncbi:MAG: peptidase S11, partial [Methylococcales bacterium]|nr:peptidase S11 [Methylococcales bacterium]
VGKRQLSYKNTNVLIRNPDSDWRISLSKTGFINEAGRCLVMLAWLRERPVIIVLLDAQGKLTPIGDSNRIRDWLNQNTVVQHANRG